MTNIKRANTSGITKTGVAISDVPDAPTIGAVADLGTGATASVAYTAATTGGAATTFTATSSPGGLTGTAASSPITVSGLSSEVAYTFTVAASNSTGSSAASAASSSLTLAAIPVGLFESIASVTLTSATSTISFTSIPATYAHLQIRATMLNASNLYSIKLRFNGDTASNYSAHQLASTGATVISGAEPSVNIGLIGIGAISTSLYTSAMITDILDYANTNKYKTVRSISGGDGNGSGQTKFASVNWRSTSAVTSIFINADGSNFNQYTSFALYGIKGS